jgi:hypothetical protein
MATPWMTCAVRAIWQCVFGTDWFGISHLQDAEPSDVEDEMTDVRITDELVPLAGGRLTHGYVCIPSKEAHGMRFLKISKMCPALQRLFAGRARKKKIGDASNRWGAGLQLFKTWHNKINEEAIKKVEKGKRKKTRNEQPFVTILMPATFTDQGDQCPTIEFTVLNDSRSVWLPYGQDAMTWFTNWVVAERKELDA